MKAVVLPIRGEAVQKIKVEMNRREKAPAHKSTKRDMLKMLSSRGLISIKEK